MNRMKFQLSQRITTCVFNQNFEEVLKVCNYSNVVLVIDSNLFELHPDKFINFSKIVITAGEENKTQESVNAIIEKLIEQEMDKNSLLVGIGGGVVTDLTGFVASIFKRGIHLALVPTTILAMADASLGGKNGINLHSFKNMAGTVYQPDWVVYDYRFLETLPKPVWSQGMAEIIKHACILDRTHFDFLSQFMLNEIIGNINTTDSVIKRSVAIKMLIVERDEFEKNDRKLLNFGHTIGHAIESIYKLPHGNAVSLGMMAACHLSEVLLGFNPNETKRVAALLQQFDLPIQIKASPEAVEEKILQDKKRDGTQIDFILLKNLGEAVIYPVELKILEQELLKYYS